MVQDRVPTALCAEPWTRRTASSSASRSPWPLGFCRFRSRARVHAFIGCPPEVTEDDEEGQKYIQKLREELAA